MTSCPHTSNGCNHPESECDGACLKQPPKHFKPQTTQQRLKVMRQINDTEVDMSINLPQVKPPLRYFPKARLDVDLTVGDDEPVSRWRVALNTFSLYRRSGCGIRQSLRKAIKALGGKF